MSVREKHCSLCSGAGHNKRTCRVRHLLFCGGEKVPTKVTHPFPVKIKSGRRNADEVSGVASFDEILRRLEKVETPHVDGSQMYTVENLETLWVLKNDKKVEQYTKTDVDELITFTQEVHTWTTFTAFQKFFKKFPPAIKEMFLNFYKAEKVTPYSNMRLVYKAENPTIEKISAGLLKKDVENNYQHQNETIPLNLQVVFLQDKSKKVLSAYARTRGIPEQLQIAVVNTGDLAAINELVESSETTTNTIQAIHGAVKNFHPANMLEEDLLDFIHTGVASHPNTPKHILLEYLNNDTLMNTLSVNKNVLTNPNTPTAPLRERYEKNATRIGKDAHWDRWYVRENLCLLSTGKMDTVEALKFVNERIIGQTAEQLQNIPSGWVHYYAETFSLNNFTAEQLTTFYHHIKGKGVDRFILGILGNRNAPVELAEDYRAYYDTLKMPLGDTRQAKYYADQMITHHIIKKY